MTKPKPIRVTYTDPVTGRTLTDREHAIIQAHRWQVANLPVRVNGVSVPSEAYSVIVDLLGLLDYDELAAAIRKGESKEPV